DRGQGDHRETEPDEALDEPGRAGGDQYEQEVKVHEEATACSASLRSGGELEVGGARPWDRQVAQRQHGRNRRRSDPSSRRSLAQAVHGAPCLWVRGDFNTECESTTHTQYAGF